MIGEVFSAQEQALSASEIGYNPFSTHRIINTTLFLVLLFWFQFFMGIGPTFHDSVQPSPTHKSKLLMQYNTFVVYPHPHLLLQYRFSKVLEPIPFQNGGELTPTLQF